MPTAGVKHPIYGAFDIQHKQSSSSRNFLPNFCSEEYLSHIFVPTDLRGFLKLNNLNDFLWVANLKKNGRMIVF